VSTESLHQIIGLVERLDPTELVVVLQAVSARMAAPTGARRSVLELQGLGKDVWKGLDAARYIEGERESWTG